MQRQFVLQCFGHRLNCRQAKSCHFCLLCVFLIIIFRAMGCKILYLQTKETSPFLPQFTRILRWDDNERVGQVENLGDKLVIYKSLLLLFLSSFKEIESYYIQILRQCWDARSSCFLLFDCSSGWLWLNSKILYCAIITFELKL